MHDNSCKVIVQYMCYYIDVQLLTIRSLAPSWSAFSRVLSGMFLDAKAGSWPSQGHLLRFADENQTVGFLRPHKWKYPHMRVFFLLGAAGSSFARQIPWWVFGSSSRAFRFGRRLPHFESRRKCQRALAPPAIKKPADAGFYWGRCDSNTRRPKPRDLQSDHNSQADSTRSRSLNRISALKVGLLCWLLPLHSSLIWPSA